MPRRAKSTTSQALDDANRLIGDAFDVHRVPGEVVSVVLGISTRQIQNLVEARTLPSPERRGREALFDLPAMVAAFVEYKSGAGDVTLKGERLRHLSAKADNEELDAEVKAGTLIHVDVVLATVRQAMAAVRGALEGMCGRQAPVYAAEANAAVIRQMMLADVREALADGVSEIDQLAAERRRPGRDGGDAPAAAAADGGPVGGPASADSEGLGGAGEVSL